jgi:hypothetical protein
MPMNVGHEIRDFGGGFLLKEASRASGLSQVPVKVSVMA